MVTLEYVANTRPPFLLFYQRESPPTSTEQDQPYNPAYFDCLPLELKVEIFSRCSAAHPRLSSFEAPLLLCRVSSSWRTIMLSTPKLWATFMLDTRDVINHDKIELLRLWLEYSRNSPLSFQVFQESRLDQALGVLIQHARRWSDVDLRLPSSSGILLQSSPLLSDLPNLRSLTLHMREPRHTSTLLNIHAFRIPWCQLTKLDLNLDSDQLLDLNEFTGILSQAIHLSQCNINADYMFSSPVASNPIKIVLPALMQLHMSIQQKEHERRSSTQITDTAESCLVSFLEQLEMPRLNSLSLKWLLRQDGGETPWRSVHLRFVSVLRSVASSLRSLSIAYLPLSDEQVLDCITHLHSLSHLDLRFSLADKERDPITDVFLRACTLRTNGQLSSEHVPSLESVFLQCTGARHSIAQVLDLIQSRWDHVCDEVHLQSFSLVSMSPVSSRTRQKLKQWSKEGLEVSVEDVIIH